MESNDLSNGVRVKTLKAEEFGGEFDRQSAAYIGTLWLAGFWAMVTNSSQALYRKAFIRRGDSFGKILWEMGRDSNHVSCFFGDRFSRYNHLAKVGAAGWRSLELFYNYHEKTKPELDGNLEGWLTRFWIGKMENRQAVTNRLKVLIDLLADSFKDFSQEPEIRLVSIASGSAQAVVEALQRNPQFNIKAILVDADSTAIAEAKKTISSCGLDNRFSLICNSTKCLEEVCADFRPHIIEMVGFLDYRPRKQAIKLINRIRKCLPENGLFITCNINKNREKILLDWLLLWPMIYRDENELADLLIQGGFAPENIQIIYEPFRIHGIAVCRK